MSEKNQRPFGSFSDISTDIDIQFLIGLEKKLWHKI